MKDIRNISLKDIPRLSGSIARKLTGGEILALIGPLGSGKTTFVQTLAKYLKIKSAVTSPTFVLMNVFPAILPATRKRVLLWHLDLYRVRNWQEVKCLGLPEIWRRRNAVIIIEWADKIRKHLPQKTQFLYFHHDD